MTTKTVYLFGEFTGEFLGVYEAQESPLEPGEFIVPVHATDVVPPSWGDKQIPCFVEGTWELAVNNRGEIWFDANRNPVEVTELGDPALLGLSRTQPDPPFAEQKEQEMVSFRNLREQYLNRIAGISVSFLIAGDVEGAEAATALRTGLLDLPADPAVVAATDLTTLKSALKGAYAALVAATPQRLRDQFAKVGA